ncbi:cupin domain-containing protein [Pseudonocardia humida]|uniref:Cupin domain-containing protein n=1 Tax=Pseudonocardia humida TaxID=2800819 RepID=A0ABT1A0T6_9PSEU|nr:cupin domain-containing protein [Pseudonocardia humida]MCO1656553.1 cupin domain-containing protein [Pseudonocardia humida]
MTNTTHLVRAADAEVLDGDPGGTITLLADAADTGGALSAHRSTFRAGAVGAPPHTHHEASELFLVLGGALRVLLGEEVTVLRAGDLLVVPAGVPHAFEAAPGHDAEVLFVLAPARERAEYYRLLDRVHRGQAEWTQVGASQDRFDNHYVDSPAWAGRDGADAN